MDAGIFLSDRKKLILFIAVPPILAMASWVFMRGYINAEKSAFKERISFIEAMPVMTGKIHSSEEALKDYSFALTKTEVIETLNKQLKEIARASSFNISSMDIVSAKETASSEYIYKISVKGEGSVPIITKFIDSIQSSGKMFVIDTVNMVSSGRELERRSYTVDIILLYYNMH